MTSTSSSWTSAPTPTRSNSPSVYTNAKAATATRALANPGTDLRPLLDLLVEVHAAPAFIPDHPLQLLVTNLAANDYVGRMAVGASSMDHPLGQRITVVRDEADDHRARSNRARRYAQRTVTALQTAHGSTASTRSGGAGDIVSVAGLRK